MIEAVQRGFQPRQVPGCLCNEEMCGEVLQVVPNAVQTMLRDFGKEARREPFS